MRSSGRRPALSALVAWRPLFVAASVVGAASCSSSSPESPASTLTADVTTSAAASVAPAATNAPAPTQPATPAPAEDPAAADVDEDGLTAADEELRGTSSDDADSDDDGFEVFETGTNPNLDQDSDGDGVPDADEVLSGADPFDPTDQI